MFKKIKGIVLSATVIVSALSILTVLPTNAEGSTFTPQHMEVDFSGYVINDYTADKENFTNNTYPASNTENSASVQKTIWKIGDEGSNKYIYTKTNSKVCNDPNPANGLYTFILNSTGKAGDSKTAKNITETDAIYKLTDGARYKISFRYKLSNWDRNGSERNTEITFKVGASATGCVGWNDNGARFKLQDGTEKLVLQETSEWKTVEVEFVANMAQGQNWGGTWMDSIMVAFLPFKKGTENIKAYTSFDLYLDDFVVDRLGTINVNKDGKTESVYGVPECSEEYRTGFGTCEAEKLSAVKTIGTTAELTSFFSDSELIEQVYPEFTAGDSTYYAKSVVPNQTELYKSTTANTGYAEGTNVFGTGFIQIKENASLIQDASNIKEGFILWTKNLLGDTTLDISCVDDTNTSALKIETNVIHNLDGAHDTLYGVLKCRDVTDNKVSDRYANMVYVARPFVSYELNGITYYVYGNMIDTSAEGQ